MPRQTWDEQEPNQDAILRHLEGDALSPYHEVRKWRVRFWLLAAAAVAAIAAVAMYR